MYCRGRPIVPVFEDGERIFFRWYRNDVNDTFIKHDNPTGITPNQVPIPDQSVNRSGLGGRFWFVLMPERDEPHDLRLRKLCMGVLKLTIDCIPNPTNDDGVNYTFLLERDPLRDNYQHCEIRVYKDGLRQTASDRNQLKKLIPKAVKKYYRAKIAEAAQWELLPEVGHN